MDKHVYSTAQIRAIEQAAFATVISGPDLMQRAGEAAFALMREFWPKAHRVLVLCGPGNNGGDGYVIASLALAAGLDVRVIACAPPKTADARCMADRAVAAGVRIETWTGVLPPADLNVDALLGIGLTSPVRGDIAAMAAAMNAADVPVFAVDVPTGINADSGAVMGAAVRADVTVTFLGDKPGLLTGDGATHAGRRVVRALDLPVSCYPSDPLATRLAEDDLSFPRRDRNSHKGNFGHVLVVGGDEGMGGAALMTAEAALRAGAGRVTLATHPDHVSPMLARRPEVMARGVQHPAELESLLAQASVVVVGPGLGRQGWGQRFWLAAQQAECPLVVDADGLYWLARQPDRAARDNRILTPHPGEAATLLGVATAEIQRDRVTAVRQLAARYGGLPVLKGAGSLIAAGGRLAICPLGNPGMAAAGMGDVLAGVLGGLVAQFGPDFGTVCRAVLVHAWAGDRAAGIHERGLTATDLLPWVREAVNHA